MPRAINKGTSIMPITQERMLALVEAGEAHERAWQQLRNALGVIRERVGAGQLDASEALGAVARYVESFTPASTHSTCIALERAHFERTHKRNARAKQKMQAKRLEYAGFENQPRYPEFERQPSESSERLADEILASAEDMAGEFEVVQLNDETKRDIEKQAQAAASGDERSERKGDE